MSTWFGMSDTVRHSWGVPEGNATEYSNMKSSLLRSRITTVGMEVEESRSLRLFTAGSREITVLFVVLGSRA